MHTICRVMIVVDDDIDPSSADEVLWAIATRSDPESAFEIQKGCPSSPLDPMIPPEKKRKRQFQASRAVIVACRPWEWLSEFPAVSRASEKLRKEVYEKWRSLFP